ncbi:hypothetical protein [Holospora curviuscula]|uniref:Uncharacterized protein n=1 Tax=Holospora curviuscula TaxID=1082868 RepID=A0A2S5R8N1_9PROT|nr:hypothetical protein [Holospora curviuscula]PPE03684.1 hypothetical protein HCUR_00914 [Holospora curviuscula]
MTIKKQCFLDSCLDKEDLLEKLLPEVLSQSMVAAQVWLQSIHKRLQACQRNNSMAQEQGNLTAKQQLFVTNQQLFNIIAQGQLLCRHLKLLDTRKNQPILEQQNQQHGSDTTVRRIIVYFSTRF